MNSKTAYRLGVASGLEAAELGEFLPAELEERDNFLTACSEVCENKRQYADHPGYDFGREPNCDTLWDEFERGESVGIAKGWRLRQQTARAKRQHEARKKKAE